MLVTVKSYHPGNGSGIFKHVSNSMKFRDVLFYLLVTIAVTLVVFMILGIVNENSRQTGAAIIIFGMCMVFISVLKKKHKGPATRRS